MVVFTSTPVLYTAALFDSYLYAISNDVVLGHEIVLVECWTARA
jgi:hypothetical protein